MVAGQEALWVAMLTDAETLAASHAETSRKTARLRSNCVARKGAHAPYRELMKAQQSLATRQASGGHVARQPRGDLFVASSRDACCSASHWCNGEPRSSKWRISPPTGVTVVTGETDVTGVTSVTGVTRESHRPTRARLRARATASHVHVLRTPLLRTTASHLRVLRILCTLPLVCTP